MRYADSLRLALRALVSTRVRCLGAIGGIVLFLILPITVLSLWRQLLVYLGTDPHQPALSRTALAIGPGLRFSRSGVTQSGSSSARGCLSVDEAQRLSGVEAVYDFTPLLLTSVAVGEWRTSPIVALPDDLFAALATLDTTWDDEVPVIVGELGVRYQHGRRVDVEVQDFVGSRTTLTAGNLRRELDVLFPNLNVMESDDDYRKALQMAGTMIDLNQVEESLTRPARIVAVAKGPESYIPTSAAEEIRQWLRTRHSLEALGFPGTDRVRRILVEATTEDAARLLALDYLDRGCAVSSYYGALERRRRELEPIVRIARWIAGLCVAGAALGIGLTVWRVVRESQHEIGVLRAMGIDDGELARVVANQAVSLGLAGTVVAIGIGNATGWLVSTQVLRSLTQQTEAVTFLGQRLDLYQIDLLPESLFTWEPAQLLLIPAVVILAVLAALPAAFAAARLDPVAAIHSLE